MKDLSVADLNEFANGSTKENVLKILGADENSGVFNVDIDQVKGYRKLFEKLGLIEGYDYTLSYNDNSATFSKNGTYSDYQNLIQNIDSELDDVVKGTNDQLQIAKDKQKQN